MSAREECWPFNTTLFSVSQKFGEKSQQIPSKTILAQLTNTSFGPDFVKSFRDVKKYCSSSYSFVKTVKFYYHLYVSTLNYMLDIGVQ